MTATAAAIALSLSIALLCVRRVQTAAVLCAAQWLLAATALVPTDVQAATVAALLGGVGLPLTMLWRDAPPMVADRLAGRFAWPGVALLLLATAAVVAGNAPGGLTAIGACVTALGLLVVALRAHPLMPACGLLSAQSGLILSVSSSAHPSLLTLVAATPLVPMMLLAEGWLRR